MCNIAFGIQTLTLLIFFLIFVIVILDQQIEMDFAQSLDMPTPLFLVYMLAVFALLTFIVYLAYVQCMRSKISTKISAKNTRNRRRNYNRSTEVAAPRYEPTQYPSQNGTNAPGQPFKVLFERDLGKSLVWTKRDVRTNIMVSSNVRWPYFHS